VVTGTGETLATANETASFPLATMTNVEELYQLAEPLSSAERQPQALAKLSDAYVGLLSGTRATDASAKRLSGQLIVRFFHQFPAQAPAALDAFLDLCEDEDATVRVQAIRDLPHLCKTLKEYLPKIVNVLAQLLQTEEASEAAEVRKALTMLFKRDPKGTLVGLFSQVRTGGDEIRERVVHFLATKIKEEGSELLPKGVEVTLMQEIKAAIKVSLVYFLNTTVIGPS